jgi:hypothetical protein
VQSLLPLLEEQERWGDERFACIDWILLLDEFPHRYDYHLEYLSEESVWDGLHSEID